MLAVVPWQCKRCGSTERRKPRASATRSSRSTGCAECHRRAASAQRHRRTRPQYPGLTDPEALVFCRLLEDDFDDVQVTGPVRGYLVVFSRYLAAARAGDPWAARDAERERRWALARLEHVAAGAGDR